MDYRIDIKSFHFHIGLSRSIPVKGVNSKLPDGRHFLMWDFDDKRLVDIAADLYTAQHKFGLPDIHIINTGVLGHYHAYCFHAVPFPECLYILASTPSLDSVFFRIGVVRQFFTLRFSDKPHRTFRKVGILPSPVPPTVDTTTIDNFVSYWTKRY